MTYAVMHANNTIFITVKSLHDIHVDSKKMILIRTLLPVAHLGHTMSLFGIQPEEIVSFIHQIAVMTPYLFLFMLDHSKDKDPVWIQRAMYE
jgi:hypothetical protein